MINSSDSNLTSSGLFNESCIMGVLNLTEDSFSDGGRFIEVQDAIERAIIIYQEGAKILDIGAESSRPGSVPTDSQVQIHRIATVLSEVSELNLKGLNISVDTTDSKVANAAIKLGAQIVNDISAGRSDPNMLSMIADTGASVILMHMQGTPLTMQDAPTYKSVTREVKEFLSERIEVALSHGIAEEQIAIDPGIGFGKTLRHNLELLHNLKDIVAVGPSVVLGTSRKRFLSTLCGGVSPSDLRGATCATTVLGLNAGVKIYRVHDVTENLQALKVHQAVGTAK